ncbi:MAG TPA: aspartyl/asparaginyl beta-hydroxylase domain-containing protein, partial [Wenzhouxiangellaceae bacterium]|nr:aspartyl/asparaginyl beta-hydroxylase domain-containing protein [Wenzhouxiangellaceae bacterium]
MRLPAEFLQLSLAFDAERLQAEIDAVPADYWQPHPQGFPGNDALILVSVGGGLRNDELAGPMRPTPALARCPYLRQVMASLRTVIGRTRLMRIAGSAEASPHFDLNYYWHQRMRIHVPIRTHPDVRFHCGDEAVHMQPGECWVFDTWKIHKVTNPADYPRVHLVCDTVGSGPFWDLLAGSVNPRSGEGKPFHPQSVPFRVDADPILQYESFN